LHPVQIAGCLGVYGQKDDDGLQDDDEDGYDENAKFGDDYARFCERKKAYYDKERPGWWDLTATAAASSSSTTA